MRMKNVVNLNVNNLFKITMTLVDQMVQTKPNKNLTYKVKRTDVKFYLVEEFVMNISHFFKYIMQIRSKKERWAIF